MFRKGLTFSLCRFICSSYYPSAHLIQGSTEDPPVPDHPPPPPPTFSFSSWDHGVYAVEIAPLGDGYLKGGNKYKYCLIQHKHNPAMKKKFKNE